MFHVINLETAAEVEELTICRRVEELKSIKHRKKPPANETASNRIVLKSSFIGIGGSSLRR